MIKQVTSPNEFLYGTISTFSLPMKSGKTIQFKADEHGNINVFEWNPETQEWNKVWGRVIYMPKPEEK